MLRKKYKRSFHQLNRGSFKTFIEKSNLFDRKYNKEQSMSFIFAWFGGTPDYTLLQKPIEDKGEVGKLIPYISIGFSKLQFMREKGVVKV